MPEENGEVGDLVTCPTCTKIWPKGTKFCTQCGTWIETGQVLEPKARASMQPPKPGQPGIGSGPPGIGPAQGGVPPQPSGAPPQSPRFRPSGMPSAPPGGFSSEAASGSGPAAVPPPPPGGPPGAVPTAPVASVEDAAGAEPPKKKYSFITEPRREERVPEGPMFIPKRDEKKKKKVGPLQVVIVIICLLAIAYAVISIAFKPLHGYLMGKAFGLAGKTEQAMKYYGKAAASGGMWADKATDAMTEIAKSVVEKHLDLQCYANWTAKTRIAVTLASGDQPVAVPLRLTSSIWYKAPGFVSENITRDGAYAGRRLLTDQAYQFRFGRWAAAEASPSAYSSAIQQKIGLTTAELFDKTNKQKAVDVLFDDVGLRFQQVLGAGENRRYAFSLDVKDNEDRLLKLNAVMAPLLPLGQWRLGLNRRDIVRVELVFHWKNGQLEEIHYLNDLGLSVAEQTFEDFQPGASIDDSVFR